MTTYESRTCPYCKYTLTPKTKSKLMWDAEGKPYYQAIVVYVCNCKRREWSDPTVTITETN